MTAVNTGTSITTFTGAAIGATEVRTMDTLNASIERALSLGQGKNVGLHISNIFDQYDSLFKTNSTDIADSLPGYVARVIELDDAGAALGLIQSAIVKVKHAPETQDQLATMALNLTAQLRDDLPDARVVEKLAALSCSLSSQSAVRHDIADTLVEIIEKVFDDDHIKPAIEHARMIFMSVDEQTRVKLLDTVAEMLPSLYDKDLNAAYNCANWIKDRPESSETTRAIGKSFFQRCDAEYSKNKAIIEGTASKGNAANFEPSQP